MKYVEWRPTLNKANNELDEVLARPVDSWDALIEKYNGIIAKIDAVSQVLNISPDEFK